jgi:AcrR family transcriptional regulator
MTRTAPDRPSEILDHALALFAERGLAGVSTRDLAEKAGLSRSHIYHYFKDWQTLRCAAFARFAQGELEQARIELARLPGRQALETFAAGWLDGTADPSAALWIDAWVEALRDPALAAAYDEAMEHWVALLENVLQRAGLPHDATLARQMFALINGYTLMAGLRTSSTKARELQELVGAIDRLLIGDAPAARPSTRR